MKLHPVEYKHSDWGLNWHGFSSPKLYHTASSLLVLAIICWEHANVTGNAGTLLISWFVSPMLFLYYILGQLRTYSALSSTCNFHSYLPLCKLLPTLFPNAYKPFRTHNVDSFHLLIWIRAAEIILSIPRWN